MRNPVSANIWMKRVQKDNNEEYYIGNCDMDISLLDTVIKVYPPEEGKTYGKIVINNNKSREHMDDEDTNF